MTILKDKILFAVIGMMIFLSAKVLAFGNITENFTPWHVQQTNTTHNILIKTSIEPEIGGKPLYAGDVIGVFFHDDDSLICGGYGIFQGEDFLITAYGEDSTGIGFEAGEDFAFMVYRKNTDCIAKDISVTYKQETGINAGSFVPGGYSVLQTLEGDYLTVSYPSYNYCLNEENPLPSGTFEEHELFFVAPEGLAIDNESGEIFLENSIPGNYEISVFSNLYCLEEESFEMKILPIPDYHLEINRICLGKQINMNNAENLYIWSTGNVASTLQVFDAGLYKVKIINPVGCSVNDSIFIDPDALTVINANYETHNADCNKKGKLSINDIALSGGVYPYTFFLENTITHERFEVMENMEYEVLDGIYNLVIKDGMDCEISIDEQIIIEKSNQNCDDMVLTPNGDGMNDEVFLDNTGMVKIYDRFGGLVQKIATPAYWDGNDLSGNNLPMGTYVVVDAHGNTEIITIIR